MTLEFSSDATIGRSGWKFSWVWVDEHDNPIDDSAASIGQGSSVMRQLSAEADYNLLGIIIKNLDGLFSTWRSLADY